MIARVNALADDPPTSTIKYLVKTLRERGDLPLQVKDWKAGGWRASNGEPPVDVPDDVDEEVVTAWNDLSPVQYRLLSARDWRGLKEPSGSRDSSASETAGPGV